MEVTITDGRPRRPAALPPGRRARRRARADAPLRRARARRRDAARAPAPAPLDHLTARARAPRPACSCAARARARRAARGGRRAGHGRGRERALRRSSRTTTTAAAAAADGLQRAPRRGGTAGPTHEPLPVRRREGHGRRPPRRRAGRRRAARGRDWHFSVHRRRRAASGSTRAARARSSRCRRASSCARARAFAELRRGPPAPLLRAATSRRALGALAHSRKRSAPTGTRAHRARAAARRSGRNRAEARRPRARRCVTRAAASVISGVRPHVSMREGCSSSATCCARPRPSRGGRRRGGRGRAGRRTPLPEELLSSPWTAPPRVQDAGRDRQGPARTRAPSASTRWVAAWWI